MTTQRKSKPAVKKSAATKDSGLHGRFMKAFFAQVPAEELVGWKSEDLSIVAQSMLAAGQQRKAGEHKVVAFTPDKKRDGWHIPHTVVQIINDDMSFIVDSVSAELAHQGLNIDVIFHPVLNVTRDKSGKLSDIHADGSGKPESCIYIQLEQMLSAESAERLAHVLQQCLKDVQAATSDWKKMLARVDDIIGDEFLWKGHAPADIAEARDFMRYLRQNNFTFLGCREYRFSNGRGAAASEIVAGSDLGVLKNYAPRNFGMGEDSPEVAALKKSRWPVMVSKLIDQYATVHRRVPMDAISVKVMDAKGNLVGMKLFVGLFTSSTYSCRTSEVPVVRRKVAETVARAEFAPGSHDANALSHILEKMPRDELFQVSTDELYALSMGILRLQAKQRIALFTHIDPMGLYMSCLVYVPRDRYNTPFREQAAKILEQGLKGRVVNYFTTLDDSPLARLLFTVKMDDGTRAGFDHAAMETKLIDLGREWDERLKQVLLPAFGKMKGAELAHVYGRAFGASYHESIDINNAVHDIRQLEAMRENGEHIRIDLYKLHDSQPGELRLKVYHAGHPVPLSDILPVLENMGMKSMSEMPYDVEPQGYDGVIWIHDFVLKGPAGIDVEKVKANFEDTFLHVWRGEVENDGLNQLVMNINLTWQEVRMLRAYSGYMRQARFPYSKVYVEQVLNAYPEITAALVDMFKGLHDPAAPKKAAAAMTEKIVDMLQQVQKLDHDRILRNFMTLIEKTLRTNYFQHGPDGRPRPCLAFKLDSKNIDGLPLPRPHVEIYVYSSRVEAVHLRGGEIARGGIRWSDRHDDFRTEILGLLKSQMVKNTVIVPVGAKGGFVVKQPPKTGGREAFQAEGVECYKLFVQSLLDITDNNVKGKIVRPKDVVCHDGIDPYLVVAADKGTATFSDIANKLSLDAGFWMADAFASGGSAGYDHKKMGITAKGGWESVKRHFREMGKDIQKEPFTMVGVGDMAGDVFGNAMLLSKQIRLVGAFNHVHIFCDPNPDAASSYAERARMFKARGGWDTYNKDLISQGGGVFDRSAKVIKLTPQIKKAFDISEDQVTPDDLMRAILKANVECIWFGGIGTFVKSSRQSHADADDKANDGVRIDGRDIRAKVVGEGANLGTTQLGRIEYASMGGRINTDFIDNSAGVDCSDHEVNIKILLSDVMARGKMTLAARDKLLEEMTDEVAALVLRDNYQQTQSLSLQLLRAKDDLNLHHDLIREMERMGLMKRSLEGLPDEEGFARLSKEGHGLTRPELSILTSFAKIVIYNQILASNIPDEPSLEVLLVDYFPKALHKYRDEIRAHKLKREIIATQVVNRIVNRMGPVFVMSRMAKTGRSAEDVIRAFLIIRDAFDLPAMWKRIEDLDNKVPATVQMSALHETFLVVKRAVTWFLRFGGKKLDIVKDTEAFRPGIEQLKKSIRNMVPDDVRAVIVDTESRLTESGMTPQIASEIAVVKLLSSASDIVNMTRKTGDDIGEIATAYFRVGEVLSLDWLRAQAAALVTANSWQARVIGGVQDDYYSHQAALTAAIFDDVKKGVKVDRKLVDSWFAERAEILGKITRIIDDLRNQPKVEVEMLVLVSQRIGQLVHMTRS